MLFFYPWQISLKKSEASRGVCPLWIPSKKGISLPLSLEGPQKYQKTFQKDSLEIRKHSFHLLASTFHTNTTVCFIKPGEIYKGTNTIASSPEACLLPLS